MDNATALASLRRRLDAKLVPDGEWNGTPHLIWTGATDRHDYGVIWDARRRNNSKVHRIAWELDRGPIPDALVIDHLCRLHPCAAVLHLEPVTDAVNIARGEVSAWQRAKTHCPNGHPYDEANTRVTVNRSGGPARDCRACDRDTYHRRSATRRRSA